jgi:L-rhamnose-H+ transport protein
MDGTTAGVLILVLAAAMNSSFTLPMKYTRKWSWENTWLLWTVYALIVLPIAVTFTTVPSLGRIYGEAGGALVAKVVIFGAGWGVAQVLFGLAVEAIGIALTFSIVLGLSAALGSVIPLVQLHRGEIFSSGGIGVLVGVALVIVGVGVLGVAGREREAALGVTLGTGKSFGPGLAIAVSSGILAAFMNFAIAFGAPLNQLAKKIRASAAWAPNTIWLLVMTAGAVPSLIYCLYLIHKNKTAPRFSARGTRFYWLLALIMALFWFISTLMYGVASGNLGSLGPALGWPLFMSLIVIFATALGYITGEWRCASGKPVRTMIGGVIVLVIAVVVLSIASRHV